MTAGDVLLVVNPRARGASTAVAAEATRLLERSGRVVEVAPADASPADASPADVPSAADAARRIGAVARAVGRARDRWGLVLAVGGDGTAGEAAEGLARGLGRWAPAAGPSAVRVHPEPTPPGPARVGPPETGPALLVLPAGTGNSLHRALWGDRPWDDVLGDALTPGLHRVRHLDLGRVDDDDRAFVLGASAGFLARVVEISSRLEGVGGRDKYRVAAVEAFGDRRPFPGRVVVDGAVVAEGPLTMVAVGGARHRAGEFRILPRSVLDDGLLDVCVIDDMDDAAFGELAGRVPAGGHLGRPGVTYVRGRSVVVERTDGEPLPAEVDGDLREGEHPRLALSVVPGAVPVVAAPEPLAG